MTVQMVDYVYYKGKKFTLMDCEKDKDMIDSAPFEVERDTIGWTCCYRGYVANYIIENDFIYLIDRGQYSSRGEDNVQSIGLQEPRKTPLNYTGSIVIAFNHDHKMFVGDFLDAYVECDEAYELYFIDGEIAEELDLQGAIRAWRKSEKKAKSKDRNKAEYHRKLWKTRKSIANHYLKYEYGCNYKLR